jgi:hypothetical protein
MPPIKRFILPLAALLLAVPVLAQVQRWVDANGQVHYSDQAPPAQTESETVAVPNNGVEPDSSDRRSRSAVTSVRSRNQPPELQHVVQTAAAMLSPLILEGDPDAVTLNCPAAVNSAKASLDSMLSAIRAEVKNGSVRHSDFERVRPTLERARYKISVNECNSARGNVRRFYLCMSTPGNHVAACGKRYSYQ